LLELTVAGDGLVVDSGAPRDATAARGVAVAR
jgi:hypothetical protein